nr:zinc finger, CCHC-type [Tanacetum cinerariifolium]
TNRVNDVKALTCCVWKHIKPNSESITLKRYDYVDVRGRSRDLPEADMKEILHQRMWETESYKSHEDHMQLYEALEKSMNRDHSEELAQDLAEARKKKKKSHESPKTPPGSPPHQPPPPPQPAGPSGASGAYEASGSSQVPPSLPPPSSTNQENLQIDEDMAPDEQAQSSNDKDIGSAYIPKRRGITELKPQDLEGPAFEIIKVFHPDVIHLQYQMEECHKLLTDGMDNSILRHNVSKPLPLAGPPGQMKATYYPDVGLEQMVPDQFWIEKECKYDIAAMYGISHWWFQRQRFYIDRHISEGDRSVVRTHMRILSVVRIEVLYEEDSPPSLELPPTKRQEDSYYCRQPMNQTSGYPTTSRRDSSNSDNESWGNSEDESDGVNDDDDNRNVDDSGNDDGGNDARDSERTDSDDDEILHIDLESHQRDLQLEVRKERYSRSKLLFQNLHILFKVDFDQGFKGLRLSSFARVLGFVKVSNDDTAIAQRRLKDKQPEEKTNMDCLVKEQVKIHLGIKVGASITVTGVPGQEDAEGNVVEKKKVNESMKAHLRKLLKYKAWLTRRPPIRGSSIG